MIGRPTKLTPEISTKILDALKAGITREAAIAAAGVARSTFYFWCVRGRKDRRSEFSDFLDGLRKAEALATIRHISIIQAAALGGEVLEKTVTTKPDGSIVVFEKRSAGDWLAARWWLERRYPNDWGRRDRAIERTPARPVVNKFVLIRDRISD